MHISFSISSIFLALSCLAVNEGIGVPTNLTFIPSVCDGFCLNFVDVINGCREQERQGHNDPLCGCTQDNSYDLAGCESCVASLIATSDEDISKVASLFQKALNAFIGACNEQIDSTTFGSSTIPHLSSLSIYFSPQLELNTTTISLSTALLRVTDNPANIITDLVSPTIEVSTSSSNATSTPISSTATEPPTQDTSISVSPGKTHTNVGAIVGGVLGVMSVLAITVVLTLLYRRRTKRGRIIDHGKKPDPQLVPYDHKYVSVHADPTPSGSVLPPEAPKSASVPLPPEQASSVSANNSPPFHSTTPGLSTSTEPFSHRPRSRAFSESFLTRIPSNTSCAGSDTNLTVRQLNIRSEADELRTQLQTMQREMVLSNDDVKNTLAMIMTHIQRLDSQFNSDWARGLTNERPPEYGSR